MSRQFMTSPLPETPETLDRFKEHLRRTPRQEPANGGPSHAEFSDSLVAIAKDVAAGTARDPFPDPLVTAQQQYDIKK